jgi:hypothetical protein
MRALDDMVGQERSHRHGRKIDGCGGRRLADQVRLLAVTKPAGTTTENVKRVAADECV